MRYLRIHTLGFAALLVALTVIHCAPTEAQADRRRRWTTYGAAERGRLVVECDMRSATCSDGRRIITTRFSPVPCEVAPGRWEMVASHVGCYSVRGLEALASTTTHLSYGAELDREVWAKIAGAAVERAGEVWRVSATSGSSLLVQTTPTIGEETWTASCRILAGTSTTIRMAAINAEAGGSTVTHTLSPGWETYSVTSTSTADGNAGVWLYPTSDGAGDIYVVGCWLTYADTPGRACWGGEAPVTCANDLHTISTEGWPTESGEISVTFTVGASTLERYIIDGRSGDNGARSRLTVSNQGLLRFYRPDGSFVDGPEVTIGVKHVVRLLQEGGRTKVFLDGAEVMDVSGTLSWSTMATLGRAFNSALSLNGSISSLRVRSFE